MHTLVAFVWLFSAVLLGLTAVVQSWKLSQGFIIGEAIAIIHLLGFSPLCNYAGKTGDKLYWKLSQHFKQ